MNKRKGLKMKKEQYNFKVKFEHDFFENGMHNPCFLRAHFECDDPNYTYEGWYTLVVRGDLYQQVAGILFGKNFHEFDGLIIVPEHISSITFVNKLAPLNIIKSQASFYSQIPYIDINDIVSRFICKQTDERVFCNLNISVDLS